MKISRKWLQTYFKKPLPESEKIAELLTFHIFEVEGIEKKTDDDVLDVKVLPDRAGYCLSYEGIARELSALIVGNTFTPRELPEIEAEDGVLDVDVAIEAKDACDKYVALRVLKISVTESPKWLKERLESVGQKSINFLVDLANFVMLDIGEPMHVFDGEKVEGDIVVRYAKAGERITTLDGKDVKLDSSVAIIADDAGPLAIAGIKGGKKAQTDKFTKNIIIEAAHFDSTIIRKTGVKLEIKTDSGKRFENNSDAQIVERAMMHFTNLLQKADPEAMIGKMAVVGSAIPEERKIKIAPEFICEKLGAKISIDDMLDCLSRGSIHARHEGEMIVVYPPSYRKDLIIPEDVVEEVGRLYGYERVAPKLPDIKTDIEPNQTLCLENKVRNLLVSEGFSEIQTYSLKDKGEIEIANPLASDKKFLRTNLSDAMAEKLKENIYYADLLGLSKIKLFEFGHVFRDGREFLSLSIGIAYKKKEKQRPNDEIKEIRDALFSELDANLQSVCTVDDTGGLILKKGKQIGTINNLDGIMELDFDSFALELPEEKMYTGIEIPKIKSTYKPLSEYPFITRDVAVLVPKETNSDEVQKIIKKYGGDLLVRLALFDKFGKDEKISYAYRLVLQSYEKTLTDNEANEVMDGVHKALKEKGWEIR